MKFTDEEIWKCYEFAKGMIGNHNKDMIMERKNWEVFRDDFRGKLGEVALFKYVLKFIPKASIDSGIDYKVTPKGMWDTVDLVINKQYINVKSIKENSSFLLVETNRYDDNGHYSYKNNNGEPVRVDAYALVRVSIKPELNWNDMKYTTIEEFKTTINGSRQIEADILGAITHDEFWIKKHFAPKGMKCDGKNLKAVCEGGEIEKNTSGKKTEILQKDNYILNGKKELITIEKLLSDYNKSMQDNDGSIGKHKAIDYTNKDNLELYVYDNIEEINNGINKFKIDKDTNPNAVFSNIEIKQYLKEKLISDFPKQKDTLIKEFYEYNYVKARIKDMANSHVYYYKDLEGVLESIVFEELKTKYTDNMVNDVVEAIFNSGNITDGRKTFLSSSINAITKKSLILLLQNGFLVNLNNIDSGIMTANAGDSAQFLFLSRAILAGFNCSNVDVRSSRYDAVIDFKGKIFRVQVKGVSGNTISFKDRDRGGQGIDTHHARNKGKRITSKDCDIYVAVDKQVGICYIIPMKDIDPWEDKKIESVSVANIEKYRENWSIISELYDWFKEQNK